ncbi:hypothetical protein H072_5354 [Dactylellina haptotyla CBS 200.50]|uniref:F-box domain-containing protein n=1 Tax=Dactylellina haptotyla (strain CBS 200.50) TaxID=1284197 RepID=S8ACV5_DACHA|nr:hypothetical protein H072_5354 [Dactylellina haptotyla CBS 200.50]
MKLELLTSPPTGEDLFVGRCRSSRFSFEFVPPKLEKTRSVGRISRKPTRIEDIFSIEEEGTDEETVLNPPVDLPLPLKDPARLTNSQEPAPIQRLPAEIHTLIASYITLPSQIIHLAWTCRRLYASLGPSNSFFWYNILHRRTKETFPSHKIEPYSKDIDYYKKCLDIMCNREQQLGCQRCFVYEKAMYTVYNPKKNDERWTQLVDIYVAKVYHGTWCWVCAKEVFESIAIIQQEDPLPAVPPNLFTEIRHHPCGHLKPGLFASRTAIAAEHKEQCPHGGYSNLNIYQHTQPDIREAKPYIMKTVIDLYTTKYKQIHTLYSPSELGKEIKECLHIKKFKMTAQLTRKNQIVDGIFGLARKYLDTKDIEDEEKRSEERFKACEHFLLLFFGEPDLLEKEPHKICFPTTRFLAFLGKQFWLRRMEEMERPTPDASKTISIRYCLDDKPKSRCGFCVKDMEGKEKCEATEKRYSPVLLIFHMISEHPDRILDDWPELEEHKTPKAEKKKEDVEASSDEDEESENEEDEETEETEENDEAVATTGESSEVSETKGGDASIDATGEDAEGDNTVAEGSNSAASKVGEVGNFEAPEEAPPALTGEKPNESDSESSQEPGTSNSA